MTTTTPPALDPRTAPALTPTLRAALEKALNLHPSLLPLDDDECDALIALRDACPEPRWLPTEDGLAVYVDRQGLRCAYYVHDGKVSHYLRPDGTLVYPHEPFGFGTWEPCPEVAR